mmetsp:Transcript_42378/g.83252  ORF Transcript_42378/g.83252 Transcript_42378/m.83252 type:complete len:460 (-) Transcript_42378:92-1471(-)
MRGGSSYAPRPSCCTAYMLASRPQRRRSPPPSTYFEPFTSSSGVLSFAAGRVHSRRTCRCARRRHGRRVPPSRLLLTPEVRARIARFLLLHLLRRHVARAPPPALAVRAEAQVVRADAEAHHPLEGFPLGGHGGALHLEIHDGRRGRHGIHDWRDVPDPRRLACVILLHRKALLGRPCLCLTCSIRPLLRAGLLVTRRLLFVAAVALATPAPLPLRPFVDEVDDLEVGRPDLHRWPVRDPHEAPSARRPDARDAEAVEVWALDERVHLADGAGVNRGGGGVPALPAVADERLQPRLDVPERPIVNVEERGRRPARHGAAAVADDEALAPELPPPGHPGVVHPDVAAVRQAQLGRERLRELRPVEARAHEAGPAGVADGPAVHLLRAGPAPASSRVHVENERLARQDEVLETDGVGTGASRAAFRVRSDDAAFVDGGQDERHTAVLSGHLERGDAAREED